MNDIDRDLFMDKFQNLDIDLNLNNSNGIGYYINFESELDEINIQIYLTSYNTPQKIFEEMDLITTDISKDFPFISLEISVNIILTHTRFHRLVSGFKPNDLINLERELDIIKDIITKTHGGDTRKNFDDHYWIESVQLALSFNRGKND